jgi:hypothetical protein
MAQACKVSSQTIKSQITPPAVTIAQVEDKDFILLRTGEIFLPVNTRKSTRDTVSKVRSIVNRTAATIANQLNIPRAKFGSVFGGVSYKDGAAIQIYVTPQLFTSYQVKYEELSLQEAFEIPVSYRPEGFYNEDSALALQELNDLEESLFEVTETSYEILDTPVYQAPLKQQPLQLTLSLDKTSAADAPDLSSIGFEETSCEAP